MSTRVLVALLVVPSLGLGAASPSRAQSTTPAPVEDRPGPVNDPAPDSPIDRPKGERFVKAPPPVVVEPPAPLLPPRQAGQGWVGWTLGTGYGWHGAGPLEANPRLNVDSNFGGSLFHFGAEVGAQWSEEWALSVVSRHQVIRHTATDPGVASKGANWAHSLFGRAAYIIPREGAQFYVGALAGGGQGFRFKIDAQPSQNLPASDTVRGGAFVLGPVAGLVLPLAERLSLVAEARLLAGLPDKAALAELNIGAQFDLFSIK